MQSEKKAELAAKTADYGNLLHELFRAKQDMQIAINNFSFLSDSKSVDVCIYQMQTAQSQYDNILRKLKNLSV